MDIDIFMMYGIVSFFYIISPGPAVFLAMSNGMSANMRMVVLSSLGNITGLFFLSTISIIGLGSIILASASLFLIVKIVGAAYLIYLGIKQLRASTRAKKADLSSINTKKQRRHYFLEGFLLAATNPKPVLFFVAIFPQFLNVNTNLAQQFFIMTGLFMGLSFLSLFFYGLLAKYSKSALSGGKGMAWFHRVTGGLFVSMGISLMLLKGAQN